MTRKSLRIASRGANQVVEFFGDDRDDQHEKRTTKTKLKASAANKQPTAQASQSVPPKPQSRMRPKRRSTASFEVEDDPNANSEVVENLPKKKLKHARINFSFDISDPVIDNLKNNKSHPQTNISVEALDQIALEGLSGLTITRLFRILENRCPNLKCTTDDNSQVYVWTLLVDKFLKLPEGGGIQAFFNDPKLQSGQDEIKNSCSKGVVIDKQLRLPNPTVKRMGRIDPMLYPVQDGFIMGSCGNYLNRHDISENLIRIFEHDGPQESLYHVDSEYGIDNVVFVANQNLRSKAILPNWTDPNIAIKLREYCVLELIAKSRTLGLVFPNDKTFGRYRIMLMAKGLITQFQATSSSPIEHHIRRFQVDRKRSTGPLVAPSVNVDRENQSSSKVADNSDDEHEEDEDDEDEDENEDNSGSRDLACLCCDPEKLKFDRGTLTMVYDVIAASRGITKLEIQKEINLPKFHLRNHLKNLASLKMIYCQAAKDLEKPFKLYRTAHRLRRKKKKSGEELEKPTGVMASWDEADLRAKKIIGQRRSSFSQAEDSLLILCRITSLLIVPGLRLSWCVHKRLVRDLMHRELVESHDKTSDACLRRIKYLKRLPNNIMSINELTTELRDDPDIGRLCETKHEHDDERLNKLFVQILKRVRLKIPNLLGISTLTVPHRGGKKKSLLGSEGGQHSDKRVRPFDIKDFEELTTKYHLLDCQSVAAIQRPPTYEQAKNLVDMKFNNVCLITMAYTLNNCFDPDDPVRRRASQWLLDKFYAGFHDKLISSVLSKLNKRSLLTRKCPAEQAALYKPKTKMSLKLNQNVLFLLNRYHSSSLIQLAQPISQLYRIDLSESNEMVAIALLTSLCSMSSFSLDLRLKIPANVVGIDQGNENFKSLCSRANDNMRDILARFMTRCGGSLSASSSEALDSAVASSSRQDGESEERRATDTDCNQAPTVNSKMDDSRRALFLLRHELKAHALDKCGSLSDCLIVQPCNVKFYSDKRLELIRRPLDMFLDQARPQELTDADQQPSQTDWLVKSFRLARRDGELDTDNKVPLEFHARLWKGIDGEPHLSTLLKLIESLLSWIIVFPGCERNFLQREFGHLMPGEHLFELLELMESLQLVEGCRLQPQPVRPRLFGYQRLHNQDKVKVVYEPTPNAYVHYCQLLNLGKSNTQD